jgi:hypothetical protein
MGGCAKAEQANALSLFYSSHTQRTETDDPGAQQWRGVQIVQLGGNGEAEVGAGKCVLGIAAVDRVASEGWRVA